MYKLFNFWISSLIIPAAELSIPLVRWPCWTAWWIERVFLALIVAFTFWRNVLNTSSIVVKLFEQQWMNKFNATYWSLYSWFVLNAMVGGLCKGRTSPTIVFKWNCCIFLLFNFGHVTACFFLKNKFQVGFCMYKAAFIHVCRSGLIWNTPETVGWLLNLLYFYFHNIVNDSCNFSRKYIQNIVQLIKDENDRWIPSTLTLSSVNFCYFSHRNLSITKLKYSQGQKRS